jgi:hypothetical protein
VKKIIRWLVIAVVVVWVIQDPDGAAALAHQAMTGLTHAAHSLSRLAGAL